jgi:hypothetical protein
MTNVCFALKGRHGVIQLRRQLSAISGHWAALITEDNSASARRLTLRPQILAWRNHEYDPVLFSRRAS